MKLLSVLVTFLAILSHTKTHGSEVGTGWQDLACEVRWGIKIRTVGWWIWCINILSMQPLHKYLFSDTSSGWVEAWAECELLGGWLVHIGSQQEQNCLLRSVAVSWILVMIIISGLDTSRTSMTGTGLTVRTIHLFAFLLYLHCASPRGGHPRSVHPRVRQQRGHLVQPQVDLQRRGLHGTGHQVQDTAWSGKWRLEGLFLISQESLHLWRIHVNIFCVQSFVEQLQFKFWKCS